MPEILQQRVEHCYQLAEHYFQRPFARPEVSLKLRGQRAGVAHLQQNKLRFNHALYQQNQAHFLQHTVAHEVAHLVAYSLFGLAIKPHGTEWQSIMQKVYQLPATRCHQYVIKSKQKTYYIYQCPCAKKFNLSARRHHLVQKGYQYLCKSCRGVLSFTQHQHKL